MVVSKILFLRQSGVIIGLLCLLSFFDRLFLIAPWSDQGIGKLVYLAIGCFGFILLALLIAYPNKLFLYGPLFWFWSIAHLMGGNIIGSVVTYAFSYTALYRTGFFKTRGRIKIAVNICLYLTGLLLQFLWYPARIFANIRQILIGGCIILVDVLIIHPLFLAIPPKAEPSEQERQPETRQKPADQTEPGESIEPKSFFSWESPDGKKGLSLSGNAFSEEDAIILQKIALGVKYEVIAAELTPRRSLSAVKYKAARLYERFGLANQSSFTLRYGGYAIERKEEAALLAVLKENMPP
jgi:SAM-dependent methyltransferase